VVASERLSKGFGESDFAQVQGDLITSESVRRVLDAGEEQAAHAKERRRQGGYGVCEDCGRPIPPERLDFLPESTRCVSCQARVDRSS
jgi:DnaK suppressor protein